MVLGYYNVSFCHNANQHIKNLTPHVKFETILKGKAFPRKMTFFTKIIKTFPLKQKIASKRDCDRI